MDVVDRIYKIGERPNQVNPKFTCFTSTKVQILTPEELRARARSSRRATPTSTGSYSCYLLY
jgi:hypothetical protein